MYDEITRDNIVPIGIRMAQNSFSLIANYAALKYFSLTTVSMVMNLSPLVTVIFAFLFLRERLKLSESIVIILGFGAVTLMILGGNSADKKVYQSNMLALLILLSNPIFVSTGMVVMRSMRKTSEWTISTMNNLFQLCVFTPYAIWAGLDLGIIFYFSVTSILVIVLMSALSIVF
jgi:drug/metabolite transporter (DMT)-like permease